MYCIYCCIQGDPEDSVPNIVCGPETEEKEEEVSIVQLCVLHYV